MQHQKTAIATATAAIRAAANISLSDSTSKEKLFVPITTNIRFSIPRRFEGGAFFDNGQTKNKELLIQTRSDLNLSDFWNYKVLLTIFKEYGDDGFPMEMVMTSWIDADGNTYITDEPLVELCMRLTLFVYLHNNTQDILHMQTEGYLYEDLQYCRSLLQRRLANLPCSNRFRTLYTVFLRRFELFEFLFRANDILFFWLIQTIRPSRVERDLEKDLNDVKEILQKLKKMRLPEKLQKCIEDRFKLPDSSSSCRVDCLSQYDESDWKITINKLIANCNNAVSCTRFEKSARLFSMSDRIFNSTRYSTSTFFYGQTTFLTLSEVQEFYESASKLNAKLKNGVFNFDKTICPLEKRQTTLTIKFPFPKFTTPLNDMIAYLRLVHSRLQSILPCCKC